jgi:hypothetical protein
MYHFKRFQIQENGVRNNHFVATITKDQREFTYQLYNYYGEDEGKWNAFFGPAQYVGLYNNFAKNTTTYQDKENVFKCKIHNEFIGQNNIIKSCHKMWENLYASTYGQKHLEKLDFEYKEKWHTRNNNTFVSDVLNDNLDKISKIIIKEKNLNY